MDKTHNKNIFIIYIIMMLNGISKSPLLMILPGIQL